MLLPTRVRRRPQDDIATIFAAFGKTGTFSWPPSGARRQHGLELERCEKHWVSNRWKLRSEIGDLAFRYFPTGREFSGALKEELSLLLRNLGPKELMLSRNIAEVLVDARERSDASGLQAQFSNLASELPYDRFSAEELMTLQLFFLSFGCASAGLTMRNAARRRAANASSRSSCLEIALRERARMELSLDVHQEGVVAMAWRKRRSPQARLSPEWPRGEAAFRKAIDGAHVAIVGPGPITEPESLSISRADVVVRIGGLTSLGASAADARTDIAYFRSENLASGPTSIESWLKANGPLLAVFKSQSDLGSYSPSRLAKSPKRLYFSGSPMLFPLMVFDVATASPASISTFGADLYLTTNTHPGYHRGGLLASAYRYWPGFAHHDIFSQRYFLRLIASTTRMCWSDALSVALSLSDSDYARQIEDFHAPQFVRQ